MRPDRGQHLWVGVQVNWLQLVVLALLALFLMMCGAMAVVAWRLDR